MGVRRGAGKALSDYAESLAQDRLFAEKVARIGTLEQRLAQVRNGKFIREGVIEEPYLPMGTSGNLLPQRHAEYDGYEENYRIPQAHPYLPGEPVATATVQTRKNKKRLIASVAGGVGFTNVYNLNTWGSLTDPYAVYENYSDTADYFIYSIYCFGGEQAALPNISVAVWKASDAVGTNEELVTASATVAATSVNDAGVQRLFVKYQVDPAKPFVAFFVRQQVIQTNGVTHTTVWGDAMLERVESYESVPSKYVAPSPREGEVTQGLLSFGDGENILTVSESSLAFAERSVTITLFGTNRGILVDSKTSNGNGYAPKPYGSWHYPKAHMAQNISLFNEARTFIFSCDVVRDRDVDSSSTGVAEIRMKQGPSGLKTSDNPAGTVVLTTSETQTLNSTTKRARMKVKFITTATGDNIFLRPEFKVTTTDATSAPYTFENFMLEEVSSKETEPSKFTPPLSGYRDFPYFAMETLPALKLYRTTDRNITATSGWIDLPLNAAAYGLMDMIIDTAGVYTIKIPKTGLYLIEANLTMNAPASGNNIMRTRARINRGGTITTYTLGYLFDSVQTNLATANGSQHVMLQEGDIISLEVRNDAGSQRTMTGGGDGVTNLSVAFAGNADLFFGF